MDEEKKMPVLNKKIESSFQKRRKNNRMIIFVVIILAILGVFYLLFSYISAHRELRMLKDPAAQEEVAKIEADKLVKTIGKLISLPEDQEPVVGTVNDANSLAEQQKFFINSQNGDKVLIYQSKAIIYRPSENKLINVGPVYVDSTSTESNIDINK